MTTQQSEIIASNRYLYSIGAATGIQLWHPPLGILFMSGDTLVYAAASMIDTNPAILAINDVLDQNLA